MSTPEETKTNPVEDAKKALETAKEKEVTAKNTPSHIDPSGIKIIKNSPKTENAGKEIEESKGIFDSMKSFYEAVTGTGRFEGDSDGLASRIGKAFGKADNITKLLTGAGIMAAVIKVFGELQNDDESSTEKNVKSIQNGYRNLSRSLKSKKQESDTLVSRIEHAMQQQSKNNNLAGHGIAMKSLAMISIKIQEGLSSISDFIYKSNLTLVKSINSLKETIDDINSSNGDVFQGLFPLLIGGIITAFGAFFLGSGGVDGVMDTLVQKVVLEIRKDLGISGEENKNKSIIGKVIESFIQEITKSLNLNGSELTKIFEGLEGFSSSKFIVELKKLFNNEKFVKNTSEFLNVITDSNKINTFFENISSISKSTDSIKTSLEEFKGILQNIPIIGSFTKNNKSKDVDNKEKSEGESKAVRFLGLDINVEEGLNHLKGAFNNIAEKAIGLDSISKSLEEIVKNIKPLSEFLSKIVERDSRKSFFKEIVSDLTESFREAFSKISSGLVDGITNAISELDKKIDDFFNGNKTLRNTFNEFLVELLKSKEVSSAIKQTTAAKINEIGVSSNIKAINMASEAGLIDIKNIPQKTIEVEPPKIETSEKTEEKNRDENDVKIVDTPKNNQDNVLLEINNLGALIMASSNNIQNEIRTMGGAISSLITASSSNNSIETNIRPNKDEISRNTTV